ncbi:flagellar protein FlaG [Clostridium homopropionicum DSM 5847]|uniref:Flagellar protein FlaG n=1 Tax=Clostridium homopropionicum DSM 5847 TaxID=1121318 RepID=A0A0L6ZDJ4_9CLOT|nr:flagellar protein FlaG [Clostridium homopropionicum]KOA21046.1 flagellar protein FlaG [Clostridium homopropionicum DSM 5847]SFF98604.1 flagellar protein FlaG [Clostridium homopropionicum]
MAISILSQGRQNALDTINNINLSFGEINTNENVELPVLNNESASKDLDHGEERYKEVNEKNVKSAVDKLNKFLQGESTYVQYERHDKFRNDFVIKIIDKNTKEVIRELPPKKILDMVAEMCKLAGVIFDEKA